MLLIMEINELKQRNDIAHLLDISFAELDNLLYATQKDKLYNSFTIDKKNGNSRQIDAPRENLKVVQQKLSDKLLEYECKLNHPHIYHGFAPKHDIYTNAKCHIRKKLVIVVDIKDFFPSINFGRILGFFQKNKDYCLPYKVSVALTQLVCHNGVLPQGAPTSPVISNLICNILDQHLKVIAKKYKMTCTRYADDITFSTNRVLTDEEIQEVISDLYKTIENDGFTPNYDKTRIMKSSNRRMVTGLIVNTRINTPKQYSKQTRAMAYKLYSEGKYTINGKEGTLSQLEGRFQFIFRSDLQNPAFAKDDKGNLHQRDYARFLAYKYLWANSQPIIFCEGKTDSIYLKYAILSLKDLYPQLVKTDDNNTCKLLISFFKDSEKYRKTWKLSSNGGTRFTPLFEIYQTNNTNKENHIRFFKEKGICAKNPVIILLDNELADKKAPINKNKYQIKKYIKNVDNVTNDFKSFFTSHSYWNITENLYLLTYRLPIGKEKAEIEDYLDWNYINSKITNLQFDRHGNHTKKEGYYNKDYLSKFVAHHYKEMDFNQFRPLLDDLVSIMNESNKFISDKTSVSN